MGEEIGSMSDRVDARERGSRAPCLKSTTSGAPIGWPPCEDFNGIIGDPYLSLVRTELPWKKAENRCCAREQMF